MKHLSRRGLGALVSTALLAAGIAAQPAPAAAAPDDPRMAIVGPVRIGAVVTIEHDPVPQGEVARYAWMLTDGNDLWQVGDERSYRIESDALDLELVGMVGYGGVAPWVESAGVVARGRLAVTTRVSGSGAAGSPLQLTTTVVDDSGRAPLEAVHTHVQWLRNGVPVIGRTGDRFYSSADDYGQQVWARVEASGSSYETTTVESARTTIPGRTAASPHVAVKLRSSKPRTVRAVITVTAPGVVPAGTVTITRGPRVVGKGTLAGGRVTVVLKRQKPGKARYRVSYSGGVNVLPGLGGASVTVRR